MLIAGKLYMTLFKNKFILFFFDALKATLSRFHFPFSSIFLPLLQRRACFVSAYGLVLQCYANDDGRTDNTSAAAAAAALDGCTACVWMFDQKFLRFRGRKKGTGQYLKMTSALGGGAQFCDKNMFCRNAKLYWNNLNMYMELFLLLHATMWGGGVPKKQRKVREIGDS